MASMMSSFQVIDRSRQVLRDDNNKLLIGRDESEQTPVTFASSTNSLSMSFADVGSVAPEDDDGDQLDLVSPLTPSSEKKSKKSKKMSNKSGKKKKKKKHSKSKTTSSTPQEADFVTEQTSKSMWDSQDWGRWAVDARNNDDGTPQSAAPPPDALAPSPEVSAGFMSFQPATREFSLRRPTRESSATYMSISPDKAEELAGINTSTQQSFRHTKLLAPHRQIMASTSSRRRTSDGAASAFPAHENGNNNNNTSGFTQAAGIPGHEDSDSEDEDGGDDVMGDFQSFAEDHMSVLTGDEAISQLILDQMQDSEPPRLSRQGVGEVPIELLVDYMMAMGADRRTSEHLALSFAAEQTTPSGYRRIARPTLYATTKKLDEELGANSSNGPTSQTNSADEVFIRPSDLVHAPPNRWPSMSQASEMHQSSSHLATVDILEAMPVKDEEMGRAPIIYAQSEPISLKYIIKQRQVRHLMYLAVLIMVGLVMGITLYFVLRPKAGPGGLETESPTMSPSLAPTYIAENLLDAAIRLSGAEVMDVPGSPQFRAIGWMSTVDTIDTGGTGSNFAQRYAMVTLYYSLKGDSWVHQEQWLNPKKHECEWSSGIFCLPDATESFRITGFDLTRNGLQGQIPPEIGLLSSATTLRMTKNRIGGSMPAAIGTMTSLVALDLSSNFITGSIPSTIGGSKDLVLLDLSNNQLGSTIPEELFNLKYLRTLVLSSNKLSGPLHETVNNLEVLVTLDLRNNELSGPVPLTLDGIPSLDIIRLDYNQFSGKLPPVTNGLVTKQTISLSHNNFEGNIEISPDYVLNPTTFRLQYVDVAFNLLAGEVSPIFGFLPTLRYIDLSGNAFVGTFPSSVGWVNLEHLAASNNALKGTVPLGLNTLTHLDMGFNEFVDGIPVGICNYTELRFLLLNNNPLGSTIPSCMGTIMSDLRDLDIANSDLTGSIPSELGLLSDLEILDLSNNNMGGRIPTELGTLTSMRQLQLDQNALAGPLPSQISKMLDLQLLHLDDNRLTGIFPSELGSLGELESLRLLGNTIRGEIPLGLCGVSTLDLLTRDIGCGIKCPCCSDSAVCN